MTTMFRYAAYAPNGPRIGDIPVPVDSSFSSPMNEVSGCTLSYLPNSAGADLLNDYVEVAVEASFDKGASWEEIPNGRYMRRDREYEKIQLLNARKYTLPGYAWQLNKSIVWETTGLNADGKRPFLSANVGFILQTLIDEAHGRDTILGLDYDFDNEVDSSGAAWNKIITIYYEPTISIYQILDNLAQQGMCDWRMQGRTLQVYNADTTMGQSFASTVRLQPGVDVKALPVKASIENLVNKALILGDEGATLELSNPTAFMPWGNWETAISNAGVTDPGTMTLLGTALLQDGGAERVQFTCELKMDTTSYFPFQDFKTGHYISGPSEAVGGFQPYRVRQINGRSDKDGKFQIDLIVNDRFVEREIRNAKKTNGIVGGASAGGSGGRPTPPGGEGQDTRQPAVVTGLVVDTDAYTDFYGRTSATLSATWAPVTTATNGSDLDVERYHVAIRNGVDGVWYITASVDDPVWEESSYIPGATYQIKVRAIGQYTTRPGVWSATQTIVAATDTTPPSIPSTPIVDSRLGIITVTWDGLNNLGGGMDADWARNLVAMGTTATPTDVIGSMFELGMMQVPDQPYNEDRYFRFRSVDSSGNLSDWSAPAGPIAATSVAQGDIDAAFAEAIDEALTGPVDGARLEPWTVPGNRVLIADTESRVPWAPELGTAPHLPANGTTLASFDDPDVTWSIRITNGTGTNGTLADAMQVRSAREDGLFPVEPDRSYRFLASLGVGGTFPVGRAHELSVTWRDIAGAVISTVLITLPVGTFAAAASGSAVAKAPSTAVAASLAIRKNYWTNPASELYIYGVTMTLAADAALVVDGSITALKIATDAIVAGKIAAGAIDGMTITGAIVRTAASGARADMAGLAGGGGFWVRDSAGLARATMQVSSTVLPGLYLWDQAGVSRVFLYTSGTQSVMSFRSPANVEVMKITDGQIKIFTGGEFIAQHPNGQVAMQAGPIGSSWGVLVNKDNGNPVFRAYQTSGDSGSIYIGHENQNIVNVNTWATTVWFGKTTGIPGTGSEMDTFAINSNVFYVYNAGGTLIHGYRSSGATRLAIGNNGDYLSNFWLYASESQVRNHSTWFFIDGDDVTTGVIERASAGAMRLQGGNGGALTLGTGVNFVSANGNTATMDNSNFRSATIYNNTTSNAANVHISGSTGILFRSTSLREAKLDIEDAPGTWADLVLALRPRTWLDRGNMERYVDALSAEANGEEVDWDTESILSIDQRIPGFVAEELIEAGGDDFILRDEKGRADGLAYERITAALTMLAQRQQQEITSLNDRITTLEGS